MRPESRAATFPFSLLPPSLLSRCLSDGVCCWMVMGRSFNDLIWTAALAPRLTEMSHWSRRSLCLWYPRALSGIRHRRWQYHREGHTGRRPRERKNSFSHGESYSWICVWSPSPPLPTHTYPLLKLWQTTNTVGSGHVNNLQWLQSQFVIRDVTVICKRHASLTCRHHVWKSFSSVFPWI